MQSKNMPSKNDQNFEKIQDQILSMHFKPNKEAIDINFLDNVDVIGFDIDNTLIVYDSLTLSKYQHKVFCSFLIKNKGYPPEIEEKDEDIITKFSGEGVLLDFENGNALIFAEDYEIKLCYHGLQKLNEEQIKSYYPNKKYNQYKEGNNKTQSYFVTDGCFETHVAFLYMKFVDLFDKKKLPKEYDNYGIFYDDIIYSFNNLFKLRDINESIQDSVSEFFIEFSKYPEKYLTLTNYKHILKQLKDKGKKLFFSTNSFKSFCNFLMMFAYGDDFLSLFDLGFYISKKPLFFYKEIIETLTFSYDDKTQIPFLSLSEETYNRVKNGDKFLHGGHFSFIEDYFKKDLGKDNLNCVFVGDGYIGDALMPMLNSNWKTIYLFDNVAKFQNEGDKKFSENWRVDNYKSYKCKMLKNNPKILCLPTLEELKYFI